MLRFLSPSLRNLVTSALTVNSLLEVDQNQIIFPMIPKPLCFEEKKITMISWSPDPLAIREKVSGHLRYFRLYRITIR